MSDHQLADWRQHALTLETEVNKVVVGQTNPVRLITTAIFARGHVLLEGDVGVGKTTLLRAFTRGIGGGYQRIEGTIDLMPNDLCITLIWVKMASRTSVQAHCLCLARI